MVSHEHKCIFIHIPKCAGTSIEHALGHLDSYTGRGEQDHRNIRMLEQPFITPRILSSNENFLEALRRIRYHYSTVENPRNKQTLTKEQYDSYYKFTFIRNPWSRAYSWYKNVMCDKAHRKILQISNQLTLKEFLQQFSGKGMLRPQTYWLKDFSGAIPLDFIGRFETLIEDYQEVCKALHLSQLTLPHKIKGSGEHYQEYYDEESTQIIANVYREEIEIFGYSFFSPK